MNPTTHTTAPDCESSQFILPDLINDCHYPLHKNPHCDAVSRASDQWFTDVAQLVESELRKYLDVDLGAYASVCWPNADAFHLRVCADFFNWIAIIDDWMEYGVVDAREAHESCLLALRDPVNFDTEQLGGKMCKSFFSRFRETAGPGCTERFIQGSELYFAAVAKQLDDRAKGNMYELQYYIAVRREIGAMKLCFALIEFAARIDLPDEVLSHPVVKALENATNDYATWVNDIISYNKEQSHGGAPWENIVSVLMHDRGLDLQGAIDYAGQMCKDAIQRFETNRVILPSWDEEVDRQVAIYVEGMQDWMVGSLHWQLGSIRYSGKDGRAAKQDRIVKLLPKEPL
ncbi:isoprenoid synthase domain-containing protein [Suillus subalutaceus]|uniref:isoprenoid synthase domain-containing protein n=1 Tax=Suillus subalutaceus TaxID=48586 RepID=UPI001B86A20A|nr:isoprenoid synthase domain-containing protein [Suillus subalutaceus]KAG1858061.1 isoprenoid synthase domain-containing protein [Suillus subalutaceus]